MMRQLDAMGFDCRSIINNAISYLSSMGGGASTGDTNITDIVNNVLDQNGYTLEDIMEMSEDSGINIAKLFIDLLVYLNEKPETNDVDSEETPGNEESTTLVKSLRRLSNKLNNPQTPEEVYQQQLRDMLYPQKTEN